MFSYLLYRFGQAIALSLPIKAAYALGIFLSDLYYLLAFNDRRLVSENLKVIFPSKTESEIVLIRRRMFNNFAKYLVDFFRFSNIDKEYIRKNVTEVDTHYIKECLSAGKGGMFVSAHLGNWELGAVVVSMLGFPILTVALPHKSRKVNEFFNSQRELKGVRVLPLGSAARGCFRCLKNNGFLGLVGDRDFTGKGMVVDFFGKPTIFPLGPAMFSLQTGAKILPTFMLRNPDDTFSLIVNKPLEYTQSTDIERDPKEIIIKYKTIFEDYIRQYPEQWYMFRRFWVE